MKKLFAIAAFLLASTAAQAQYTFEYGGRTIRIDPDRGTVSIPGVYDNTGNTGRRTKRSRSDQDSDRPRKQAPQEAKIRTTGARSNARSPRSDGTGPGARETFARAFNGHGACCAVIGYHYVDAARRQRTCAAGSAGYCPGHQEAGTGARRCDGSVVGTGTEPAGPRNRGRPVGKLAARRVADGRERRQGPDRAMRQQSLWIFRGREVEPERRKSSDQHEAREGQMERTNLRSEYRQHL